MTRTQWALFVVGLIIGVTLLLTPVWWPTKAAPAPWTAETHTVQSYRLHANFNVWVFCDQGTVIYVAKSGQGERLWVVPDGCQR